MIRTRSCLPRNILNYRKVARRSTPLPWVRRVAGCGGPLQECCSAPLPPADLALGFGERSSCLPDDISDLKERVTATLAEKSLHLERSARDRNELPIDYRFLDLLLRASADPEVLLGSFVQGVKVGPGTRMPRLHAADPRGAGGLSRKKIRKNILRSVNTTHLSQSPSTQHFSRACFSMAVLSLLYLRLVKKSFRIMFSSLPTPPQQPPLPHETHIQHQIVEVDILHCALLKASERLVVWPIQSPLAQRGTV